MIPSSFEYHSPATLSEAASLLAQHGENAKLLAGGHSLLPLMKLRLAQPEVLIDLGSISDLSFIRESDSGLSIGAMTTYFDLATSDVVKRNVPILADAASKVADVQVRNRGTIGGSISHADPSGDLPGVVMALEAEIVTNSRSIAVNDFFVDLLTTALNPDEIVTEIRVPALPPGTGTAYAKFANKASHYAIVGVAAAITADAEGVCQRARIGVTGSGPMAVRATECEVFLQGKPLNDSAIHDAAQLAGSGIDFLGDIHASSEYRAAMTAVFAERAIREALS